MTGLEQFDTVYKFIYFLYCIISTQPIKYMSILFFSKSKNKTMFFFLHGQKQINKHSVFAILSTRQNGQY